MGLSLAAVSRGYSLVVMHRLLITVASHAADDKTQGAGAEVAAACGLSGSGSQALEQGSGVAEHGLSCSLACGLIPAQRLNLCPLHWQADSFPPNQQGSPGNALLSYTKSMSCGVGPELQFHHCHTTDTVMNFRQNV